MTTNLDAAFDLLEAYSVLRKAARRFELAGNSEMAGDTRKAADAILLMARVADKRHREA